MFSMRIAVVPFLGLIWESFAIKSFNAWICDFFLLVGDVPFLKDQRFSHYVTRCVRFLSKHIFQSFIKLDNVGDVQDNSQTPLDDWLFIQIGIHCNPSLCNCQPIQSTQIFWYKWEYATSTSACVSCSIYKFIFTNPIVWYIGCVWWHNNSETMIKAEGQKGVKVCRCTSYVWMRYWIRIISDTVLSRAFIERVFRLVITIRE